MPNRRGKRKQKRGAKDTLKMMREQHEREVQDLLQNDISQRQVAMHPAPDPDIKWDTAAKEADNDKED